MYQVLVKCLSGIAIPIIAMYILSAGIALAEPKRANEEYFDPNYLQDSAETSWAIGIDNDILVPGSRDQDYTYGFNVTFVGQSTEDQWASLHGPLDWINLQTGFDNLTESSIGASKTEYGLFGFTPEDITQSGVQSDDRPYASLVYVSSSREQYYPIQEVSWQSTLTLGFMGLSIVGDFQNQVHSAVNGIKPMGWDNQISAGGEPTARYSISRQGLLSKRNSELEFKNTFQASLGYITEASWSLSGRAGNIQTPWVSFNPELANYGEKSVPNTRVKVTEQYVWAGISLKARAYNAFLQGQFKESSVTYDSDEINHVLVETWLGYTLALTNGYSFTYSIRGHTSELKKGKGDRNVIWGGVLISRTIG